VSLQQAALDRILGLDPARSAQLALQLAQDQAQASSGAVLVVDGAGYVVFVASELDQQDLERIASTWARSRQALLAGAEPALGVSWALLPIGWPVAAVAYLGRARSLTRDLAQQIVSELGPLLELALSVRGRTPEAKALHELLLTHTPLRAISRQKLELVLRACDGNKTRAAELLHVTRPTLYKWLGRGGTPEAPAVATGADARPAAAPTAASKGAVAPDQAERFKRVCPKHSSVLWVRGDEMVCPKGHVARTWDVV
jgi:hypothetical protein